MNSNSGKDAALVDAVLRDEDWQATQAALKLEVLEAFHARQRLRRFVRWGSLTALMVLGTAALPWLHRSPAPPLQGVAVYQPPPKANDQPGFLTDEQLLAAFPKGSCFIAEVDGRKELVFLDPEVERAYLAETIGQRN